VENTQGVGLQIEIVLLRVTGIAGVIAIMEWLR